MNHPTNRFLPENEAAELISTYTIPYPDHRLASSPDEAARAAEAIGYPVVLKTVSPDVLHKSDVGGVVMDLQDPSEVYYAYERMTSGILARCPGATVSGALVCKQEDDGVDVIIGGLRDATFGPTVMFGLGGIFAEVLDDVAFRVAPVSERAAQELIHEIRGWKLLAGARGTEPCDIDGLANAIVSVSRLMVEHPEVASLDLNPVRVLRASVRALDARIEVEANV